MAADFEGVGLVQAPKPFTRMDCCECGAAYGRAKSNFGTELHIKNVGWV